MSFEQALADFRYLKNRGYPDKAALKLVSDRYRLSGMERNCLFRAVFSAADCEKRQNKLVAVLDVNGCSLGVDWYNVLITVESYLKGFPVFISDDGLVRDSSGIHGSYRPGKITGQAIEKILITIDELRPLRVALFLDSPIAFSGHMADTLRGRLSDLLRVPYSVAVYPSADYPLKSFDGIVATSDSSVIDRGNVRQVIDLSRYVIERSYGITIKPVDRFAR
jgi:hypothetical protein